MKKLLLIYNPKSGTKSFKNELDICIETLQSSGYIVTIFRLNQHGDLEEYLFHQENRNYDCFAVSGGDGTINIVVNCIMKYSLTPKLGIFPFGTANDFASFLKIPKDAKQASDIITNGKTTFCDVGLANDTYFINVFAAGLLTNISQHIDNDFKNVFGKLAYYLKGIEQIPNFVPIPVIIKNSREIIEESVYLFLVLNSSGAGGFEKLTKYATIDDGAFEFIAIKACPLVELAVLFIKILARDFYNDPNIIYFSDHHIYIECLSENISHSETDIDGELGPELPVCITTLPHKLEIFVP